MPIEIDPDETLLRSLRKKDVNRQTGNPKVSALKPGGDRTELSLIRARIGEDAARQATLAHVHKMEFWAFGAATAEELKPHSVSIVDDRITFHGHANMDLGYSLPKGGANTPADMTQVYEDAMKRLEALARVFNVNVEASV